jgi:hypothetical protein
VHSNDAALVCRRNFRENAMSETKTSILGAAGAVLMTMGLIAALNAYVTSVQTSAPRVVLELEPVTVTAERPVEQPALAETQDKKPASL